MNNKGKETKKIDDTANKHEQLRAKRQKKLRIKLA